MAAQQSVQALGGTVPKDILLRANCAKRAAYPEAKPSRLQLGLARFSTLNIRILSDLVCLP